MLKFLGFVRVYDLEVLLTHGHKVYVSDVVSVKYDWGESYKITYSYPRHTEPKFPVTSLVAFNFKRRLTHKLILWWKEGS